MIKCSAISISISSLVGKATTLADISSKFTSNQFGATLFASTNALNLADDLEAYPKPKSLCIIGNLVENHFNGKVTNQINCDFIEVNEDNYQTTLANTLIEMASQRNFNSSKNA